MQVTAHVTAAHDLSRVRARGALERAFALAAARGDFRIVDHGVSRSALALIVEAADREALARGMQGFQVAAARALNRSARRRGRVFVDRYQATPLASAAAVTRAIAALPRLRVVPRAA